MFRRAFATATRRRAMPEGPEVSSLADGLMRHVRRGDARIVGARIVSGRYATNAPPEGWDTLNEMLPLHVRAVRNKGKFMYYELSEGVSLWSTLGMSGGWTLRAHRHARLELDLDLPEREKEVLTFYDSRNFGTFKACFDDQKLRDRLARLGPSWTEPGQVTLDAFRALLRRGGKPQRERRLAVFLMDQTKTAGVGNYILAEALYAARIHPWARVGDIAKDDAVVAALHAAISEISTGSMQAQIVSAARRAGLTGGEGGGGGGGGGGGAGGGAGGGGGCGSGFALKVYGKQTCPRGLRVRRDKSGPHKRTIHWVPAVQVVGAEGAEAARSERSRLRTEESSR